MPRLRFLIALGTLVAASATGFAADSDKALDDARALWRTGKYAESLEAYDAIKSDDAGVKAKVAIGRAETLNSTGEVDKAIEALKPLAEAEKPNADALARLADIDFQCGRWAEADAAAKKAIAIAPDHLLAHFVDARVHEVKGESKEADAGWKWFVEYRNAHKAEVDGDADALILVGQAAERYYWANARGEELADALNDVINDVYETALKVEPKCWQAPWLEGRLFLNGYRERDARRELNKALLINPSAVEVIVTLGRADLQGYKLSDGRKKVDDAIEINPRNVPAYVLLADLNISDEKFADALTASKKAIAENPKDADALARLAASYRLLVDPVGEAAVEAVARSLNPKPAVFYAALGERLADRRKYHAAERAFLRSIEADPQRPEARIGLGMLYMQIGREQEAQALFNAAFAADPFNVRADNMMRVLKELAKYKSLDTDHYRVTYLPGQDDLLAKYMSRYLESVHADLSARLGFEPPGRSVVEIMKDHQWFSGRTTGLPFIPTVGACTGKLVALASPTSTKKPFNWARVMVHEMTHVINLQQTEFNIPHWYTEALAVESERSPRPQEWNKLLQERVPARKLLNLDTINLGFIRPSEPDERQLAYCQAQLYAQYMIKRFGPDAQIKLLDAYRRGLTTDLAVTDSFKVEKADFEKGYLEFLDNVVKSINTRVANEPKLSFSQWEKKLAEKPDDPELNARMAYEHFARRDYKEAAPFATKALKLEPHQPLASYVKARLFQSIGDDDSALELLKGAFDPKNPNERVTDLLAELQMKAGELDEAEKLYEIARKDDPFQSKWIAGLARVQLRRRQLAKTPEDKKAAEGKLLDALALLAANDADDIDVRKNLAEAHFGRGEFDKAAQWATECLYIDVNDPIYHVQLADALAGSKKYPDAIEEYDTSLTLKPKKPNDIRVKLAQAQLDAGKLDDAKATLETVLKADPEHPKAKELKEKMGAEK